MQRHLAWLLLLLQAVERAIRELTGLHKPLVTEDEVAALTMGARSKEKVLEIIQTGTLRRNEMMADDEEQQIKQMVMLCNHCVHDKPRFSIMCMLHSDNPSAVPRSLTPCATCCVIPDGCIAICN